VCAVVGSGRRSEPPREPPRSAYEKHVAKSDAQRRGPGRPLPEFTLTEPKTVSFAPGQKAEVVSLLTDMIINYLREQTRGGRCASGRSPTNGSSRSPPRAMILWFERRSLGSTSVGVECAHGKRGPGQLVISAPAPSPDAPAVRWSRFPFRSCAPPVWTGAAAAWLERGRCALIFVLAVACGLWTPACLARASR
jgi:hypothetical protein